MQPNNDQWERAQEAAAAIRSISPGVATAGIVLGSGLGGIAHQVSDAVTIDYSQIPYFPRSTAVGHQGRLVCGVIEQQPVVIMQGRMHLYEGYSPAQVTLPIRTLHCLGIRYLFVTNAGGGLNPAFRRSEIMLIDDHINLMFANPLQGSNEDRWGPRFPDMSRPYDLQLIELAQSIGRRQGIRLHQGVYAGVRGPTYETRAEYRMLRRLGADVVGMSTIPEVIVAVHSGLRVLGLSIVTNVASPDALPVTTHDEVVDAADVAAPAVATIIRELIAGLAEVRGDGMFTRATRGCAG
jgi:purine-nucleoside phosphorylase